MVDYSNKTENMQKMPQTLLRKFEDSQESNMIDINQQSEKGKTKIWKSI
jgi:hypothetical protein